MRECGCDYVTVDVCVCECMNVCICARERIAFDLLPFLIRTGRKENTLQALPPFTTLASGVEVFLQPCLHWLLSCTFVL